MALCRECNVYYRNEQEDNKCSYCFNPDRIPNNIVISDRLTEACVSMAITDDNYKHVKLCVSSATSINRQEISTILESHILMAHHAHELYNLSVNKFKEESYILEHFLCCRVINFWNIDIDLMNIGYCYYTLNKPIPSDPQFIKLPPGEAQIDRYIGRSPTR